MVDTTSQTSSESTVFDLAVRLGVRTQVILETLNSLGLEIEDPMAPLDPDVEERLVERMVQSGQVSTRALKAAKKPRQPQQPLADDRILKEALGASHKGYSEEALPPRVSQPAAVEKPSLLERLGLRRPGRREEPDLFEEALAAETETTQRPSPPEAISPTPDSPPGAVPRPEAPAAAPAPEDLEEEIDLDFDLEDLTEEIPAGQEPPRQEETPEPDQVTETAPETAEEETPVEEAPAETTEDISEEELDLGDLDLGEEDEESLDDIDESSLEALLGEEGEEGLLEGLEDLDLGELTEPHEEEQEAPTPEEDTGEEKVAGEAEEEKAEIPEEEEVAPNLLERIVLKLNLSPAEMITAAVGSLLIMVTALTLTVYYYLNYSPRRALELYDQGYGAYHNEILGDARLKTVVDSFTQLLKTFPNDPHLEEAAYYLAMAFYRRAEEVAENNLTAAGPLYADTVVYFEKFLHEQRNIGDRRARRGESRYMRTDWEEDARYHIALSYEKQREHQQALKAYEEFLKYYAKSDRTPKIRITLGHIYRDWAKVDENFRAERLQKAIGNYKEALADPSASRELRIELHTNIADMNWMLYETTKEQYRQEFLEATLREYREAEKLVRTGSDKGLRQRNLERNLALGLADTLLTMGQNAAAQVRRTTEAIENIPRSDALRDYLTRAAEEKKETADGYLSEAAYLYSRLLGTTPAAPFVPEKLTGASGEILDVTAGADIEDDQEVHVKSNLAEAYFHMGMYDKAMNTAIPVIEKLRVEDPKNEQLGPLCYLVGDAAWELGEYRPYMLDYYKSARQYKPFFPEGTGDRSNEAALKMANVYYSRGMEQDNPRDLRSAIDEYNRILVEFPQTDWTYLTRYWLAKTYEKYADVLSDANSLVYSPAKAKEDYQNAYMQYQMALEARTYSTFVDKKHKNAMKDCYFRSGRCAYEAGDLRHARRLLAGAIQWSATSALGDPRAIPCRELLADIYIELGHPDRAVSIYKHYLDKKFHQQDIRGDSLSRVSLKLARAYLLRFSYGDARDVLRRVVRDNPVIRRPGSDQAEEEFGLEAQRLLARSYRDEANGSFDEHRKETVLSADREYQILLKMNPDEHDALRALAEINFDLGGSQEPVYYQQAADYYQKYIDSGAAEAQPDRDVIYYRSGDCYYRLGDFAKAVTALTELTGTTIPAETYARALLLMGECFENLSAQQTDAFTKDFYKNLAKKAYFDAINKKDPFVTQVANNKITMMTLSPSLTGP